MRAGGVLDRIVTAFTTDPRFGPHVALSHYEPPRPARWGPWPEQLAPQVKALAHALGVKALYTHQSEAITRALAGEDVLLLTPPASGKSLAYLLPILHSLLTDPTARALCLFPTKALTQDQRARFVAWLEAAGHPSWVGVYDGDTPPAERRQVRRQARVLLTNPDMLHRGILPRHTQWADFWRGLRWIVLDEVHTYRGVFGSHVANVLRRLLRVAAFYGAAPQVICTSATVGNPEELAQRLLDRNVSVIAENGAPRPPRWILLYNPPLVDAATGLRRNALQEAAAIAAYFVRHGSQVLTFARSRQSTELLLVYLREQAESQGLSRDQVRGYRAGYLPRQRRAIEQGLRDGNVRAAVATNALELGIDIGTLDAVILVGYPGSVASTYQQWGRAGRRETGGIGIFVASNTVIDQYLIQHPEFLLARAAEHALLMPDNPQILLDHLRCALYELPMRPDEAFGSFERVGDLLVQLEEDGEARQAGGRYYWIGAGYPADRTSLRTTSPDRLLIQVLEGDRKRTLGEVDGDSAVWLVHPEAIYVHEGETYQVSWVDWERGEVVVTPAQVDFYTQPISRETLHVSKERARVLEHNLLWGWGELTVYSQVVGYRRIRWDTHEVLGYREVSVPPRELDTTGCWLAITDEVIETLRRQGAWRSDSIEDYGPNWQEQRRRALERDGYRCRQCGAPHHPQRPLHVHHIRPFRLFGYVPGENTAYLEANRLENLITLCSRCHRRAEAGVRLRTGLNGLAYLLKSLAPLFVMTDPGDLGMAVETQSSHTGLPTITLYDNVPGGIGLAEHLYEVRHRLIVAAWERVTTCPCDVGCPACVGPVIVERSPEGWTTKALTRAVLAALLPLT